MLDEQGSEALQGRAIWASAHVSASLTRLSNDRRTTLLKVPYQRLTESLRRRLGFGLIAITNT